jgi:hypothetical protein
VSVDEQLLLPPHTTPLLIEENATQNSEVANELASEPEEQATEPLGLAIINTDEEQEVLSPEEIVSLDTSSKEQLDDQIVLANEGEELVNRNHHPEDSEIPDSLDERGLHLTPEEVLTQEQNKNQEDVQSNKLNYSDKTSAEIEPLSESSISATLSPDDEQAAEEVAPDPFHPEQEEILEEIEQEKVDKEVEQQGAVGTVELPQAEHEITLPVHDEDNQIIDDFVESQHYPTTSEPTPTETPNVAANSTALREEPLIPIEPYYTVDYFASQGIRFTPEKNPQDKLGKQLKSFTQWLKHMKKLGPEDALKPTEDQQVDTKIQGIANVSNTPREIVTEAMAAVLEKQGKKQQAIEVYDKLSFLNPDKRTYFADKIQNLKGI